MLPNDQNMLVEKGVEHYPKTQKLIREYCQKDTILSQYDFCFFDDTSITAPQFYSADFNGDRQEEIITNGIISEQSTEIFKVKEDSLVQVFSTHGELLFINTDLQKILVHRKPCCAQRTHLISTYKYTEDLQFENISNLLFFSRKASMTKNKEHRVKEDNQSIVIRWSPNTTDFDPSRTCKDENYNVIGYVDLTTPLKVHFKESNWQLIEVAYNKVENIHCLLDGQDDFFLTLPHLKVMGWTCVDP